MAQLPKPFPLVYRSVAKPERLPASTIARARPVYIDGLPEGGEPSSAVQALTAVTAANATAAAAAEPTKAEFDVLVTLANANKTAINAIITALKA